jgi:hypothetical protein
MMMLASMHAETIAKDNDTLSKIENSDLQEIALTHSPWLTKLSAYEVIEKANQITQTKAKIYLFREWCLQNKKDANAHLVIDLALDTIVADRDYRVPLRDLRQLSEPLRNCTPSLMVNLCNRFDIPLFTSLHSPFEERVRLELNLAEALVNVDNSQAWGRFDKVYNEIFELTTLDADISCYCLVRLLISLDVLNPSDDKNLKSLIKKKIEDEFIRLIDTAAHQFNISRKILRALSTTDPELALTFAELLNVSNRRDKALQDVLIAYVRQDRLNITSEFLEFGLAKIYDSAFREQTIFNLVNVAKKEHKLEKLKDFCLKKVNGIQDLIIRCKIYARLISIFPDEQNLSVREKIFNQLLSDWEKVDILWYRIEMAFDLASIIAPVDNLHAKELFNLAVEIRDQVPLANQALGKLIFETLNIIPDLLGYFDLNIDNAKQTWDEYLNAVNTLPAHSVRIYLLARAAIARLLQGDKAIFEKIVQNQILNKISLIPESEHKQKTIASISYAIFEYSPDEAEKAINDLSYSFANAAWGNIAYRVLTKTNIGDNLDIETPDISLDLPRANKALLALNHIENDETIYLIVNLFTHLISLNIAELNETQKLDLLLKLGKIVDTKLPDRQNIDHPGYQLLALATIEKAKRTVAKRAKHQIKHLHHQIVEEIIKIDNIADRVYVNSLLAAEFKDLENGLANKLIEEAFESVSQIPNIQDRIDRLEVITKTYSQLRNTSKVSESIRLGVNFARTLEGVQKDSRLASIIQMAYGLDKNLASEITEKIEDASTNYSVDIYKKSLDLSKSPQKLLTNFDDFSKNEDVIKDAASKMLKALMSGKGTSYPDKTVNTWLLASSHLSFETGVEVAKWAIAETIRSIPDSKKPEFSQIYTKNLLYICEIIMQIGSHISFLSSIPDTLKTNFQGLSTTQEIFKVGERNRALHWISNWLRQNAKEYIKICDPYFDKEQIWVIKAIPADINIKVVCAAKGLDIKKISGSPSERKLLRQKVIDSLNAAWSNSCTQSPPNTLIVIHETVNETEEKDEFHDRFIVTKGGGLSIGSSFNGLGKKECVVKILSADDACHIEENYINPKQNISEIFSKVLYFELGE